ncbi:hypothetical protein LF1_41050 [Rubripirellula obstinata]|uniref:Uncharacterized protein n=1 Tax=Rubripirellula obstinata TaxID=406547 RepID=A0A5B1CNP1_9BACT|nr:hypothetical protein LF1_41050 [Rubripirellula obstinata]
MLFSKRFVGRSERNELRHFLQSCRNSLHSLRPTSGIPADQSVPAHPRAAKYDLQSQSDQFSLPMRVELGNPTCARPIDFSTINHPDTRIQLE